MRAPRTARGAALLVVMVSIAVVTALSVDLAYQTRVSLQMAANARDELRATAMARGAVNVARLVLHFQAQLDQATAVVGQATAAAAGGAPKPGAPAQPGAKPQPPPQPAAASPLGGGVRLWELVPIDSQFVPMLLGGAAAPAGGAPPPEGGPPRRSFGDFEGAFQARIEDEDRKVNLRQLNGVGALPVAQAARLAELVKDDRWAFLFDEDDANGMRASRRELFGHLKDWVDEDEQVSVYSGDPLQPFEQGTSDENGPYQRLDDRYEAKNAWWDSLDELYLVAGVSDAFMAAFGEQLTIYPDVNALINVNGASRAELVLNALVMSDPPGVPQPALLDPAFGEKLEAALALARPLPFLSISPQQFAAVVQALGVRVHPDYLQARSDARGAFGDRSSTFRIRATGQAGDVTKQIQAVVLFDRRAGPLAQDLGRLVHWHEE